MGDQPGICPLSVTRSLVTVDLKKSIYRFRANPEGEDRAASCRPPSVLAPGSALGRVATEPYPPSRPRVRIEYREEVSKGSWSGVMTEETKSKPARFVLATNREVASEIGVSVA